MAQEISIFAKKRTSSDGKPFVTYLSTLVRKGGEKVPVEVKFADEAGSPKPESCPCNIIVEKANMQDRKYVVDAVDESTGAVYKENRVAKRLWVSKWKNGSAYVDHSMDDYEGF